MILLAGLLLGVMGSLHCVGMCGPIVITAYSDSGRSFFANRLVYNSGRVVTYTLFGAIVGLIGELVELSGIQQIISIIAGTFIILLAILYMIGLKQSYPKLNVIITWIKHRMGTMLKRRGLLNDFTLGLINGFLPCGLVYLALAGAILTSGVLESTLYMLAFGIGTIPALFLVSYMAPALGRFININRFIPIMFAIMGALLIIRGLGLGIPYLSPEFGTEGGHIHNM